MHKAVIILTKAGDSKYEALEKVKTFLAGYQDDVWDWYAIGGRWNNNLAPKFEEWREKAHKEILTPIQGGGITHNDIKKNHGKLQKLWKDLGMAGEHPYCDNFKLPEDGNVYDVIPLKDCLHIVKDWVPNPAEVESKHKEDLERWKDNPDMLDYIKKTYRQAKEGEFSFEINLYNIETNEADTIPKNLTHYWAVMVDMHN